MGAEICDHIPREPPESNDTDPSLSKMTSFVCLFLKIITVSKGTRKHSLRADCENGTALLETNVALCHENLNMFVSSGSVILFQESILRKLPEKQGFIFKDI